MKVGDSPGGMVLSGDSPGGMILSGYKNNEVSKYPC